MSKICSILVCLSGRGDKDIDYVYEKYGCGEKFKLNNPGIIDIYDIKEHLNKRVDVMVKDGLLEEVKSFYDKNIRTNI